jgi:hypothetical protein
MNHTANYQLKKPEPSDYYDVEDFNSNADIIDAALHELSQTVVTGTVYGGQTQIDITLPSELANKNIWVLSLRAVAEGDADTAVFETAAIKASHIKSLNVLRVNITAASQPNLDISALISVDQTNQ